MKQKLEFQGVKVTSVLKKKLIGKNINFDRNRSISLVQIIFRESYLNKNNVNSIYETRKKHFERCIITE